MNDDRDLSALLRDGMAAEARQATADAYLTERIIRVATTAEPAPVKQRAWRAWMVPAAAAALVAVLLVAVLAGTKLLSSSPTPPANGITSPPVATTAGPTPTTPAPTSTPSATASPSGTTPTTAANPGYGAVPAGFRATDLTWINADDGWALGTAPCATAPCTSIVRTQDGGLHWVGIPAPKAELTGTAGCSATCVSSLRFANADVGYAYGPSALYLTTNAGRTWSKQSGGAFGLEIADGTVVRVVTSPTGCLPGCAFSVQTAAVGATSWHSVALPAGGRTSGVRLARSGKLVVIATEGNPAGGASGAQSDLFVSHDDGATWASVGEPCPQLTTTPDTEVDSIAITTAEDGSITALCSPRVSGTSAKFVVTSTDGGAHFTASARSLGAAAGNVLGAASASTLLVDLDELYRTTNGGATWQRTRTLGTAPTSASYIGFENAKVGRVIEEPASGAVGSATIWTTTDAGATWRHYTFG